MSAEALFGAITAGDRSAVARLLDQQPDLVGSRNSDGLSPLIVALYHGHRELAADILARLAAEQLTIHEAASVGNVERIVHLLAIDPDLVNAWSPDGFQPLGLAAFFGHAAAVEMLLARGGELNTPARHKFGVTALHAALAGPTPEIARALIAAGADVNATQRSGETALQEAAFNGYVELAQLLLDNGANPQAVNGQGQTALDIARARGHNAVADLLARVSTTT